MLLAARARRAAAPAVLAAAAAARRHGSPAPPRPRAAGPPRRPAGALAPLPRVWPAGFHDGAVERGPRDLRGRLLPLPQQGGARTGVGRRRECRFSAGGAGGWSRIGRRSKGALLGTRCDGRDHVAHPRPAGRKWRSTCGARASRTREHTRSTPRKWAATLQHLRGKPCCSAVPGVAGGVARGVAVRRGEGVCNTPAARRVLQRTARETRATPPASPRTLRVARLPAWGVAVLRRFRECSGALFVRAESAAAKGSGSKVGMPSPLRSALHGAAPPVRGSPLWPAADGGNAAGWHPQALAGSGLGASGAPGIRSCLRPEGRRRGTMDAQVPEARRRLGCVARHGTAALPPKSDP